VPTIRPFAALRYDPQVAGPLESLVAPPYDVISPDARRGYLSRNPYNVVHLTLPDSEEQAGSDLADWRERGVLIDEAPRYWWVAQDYRGPDGIPRTREGLAASVPVTPYETGESGMNEPNRWNAGKEDREWRGLRPELVVEVTFDHVSGRRIRHGTRLVRFRDDKPPKDCLMEQLDS